MGQSKTPDKEDFCAAHPRVDVWKRPLYRLHSKVKGVAPQKRCRDW